MQNENDTLMDEVLEAAEAMVDCGESATAEAADAAAEVNAEMIRRIGELEERLRAADEAMALRERELECVRMLSDAGLPAGLSSVVMASSDMESVVRTLSETVASAVTAEIVQRCRGEAPVVGSGAPISREELLRLPLAELQKRMGR